MIQIEIPGNKKMELTHLVLDYNGTLAIDGKLIKGTGNLLGQLSEKLSIHMLTADTFGTAAKALEGINCSLEILNVSVQDVQKEKFVNGLGRERVVAIGNGRNDGLMLKSASLGIAVVQAEGAFMQTLLNADVVCVDILDALELLLVPKRLVATLRN